MSMQLFFERLREERLRLDLTQEELAGKVGVSKRSYCAYEAGETAPSAKLLAALIGMGADVAYLLTGQRSPRSPALTSDEAVLLDNFRHSPPAAQAALRATSAALAQRPAGGDERDDAQSA